MQNKKKFSLVLCLVALLVVGTLCLSACTKKDSRSIVTFEGVEEIHAPVGTVTEESLLAGVTATDANGKKKDVTLDLGDADLSKPGRYLIEYKVGDNVKREAVYLYGDISFQINGQDLQGDKLEIDFATAINSLHFAKIASAKDSFGNTITATLVEGDKFDYAVGEYTAKYTATDKAGQTVEKTVTYTVTSDIAMTVQSGVSVKYEQDSVTFKIGLDGETDVWLMANGGLVSIADYTVTENGLVLKSSYFRTLPAGENTLKLCSVNGSTEFSFTVVDTGKPLFTFDSIYRSNIIAGSPAVYKMPKAQIAGHEYSYTFKVTKNGVAYKAEQKGNNLLITTTSGKPADAGVYDITVTATNKADTSKKTTIKRDFRIYSNQTEIDGWKFVNDGNGSQMVNIDLSEEGYYRTAWDYKAKTPNSWNSRIMWPSATKATFQNITFDFYVYSLGIADKENGPVKYVGKNDLAEIPFYVATMSGEGIAMMFYDQNGKVVAQDQLKMNTWYTVKLDVSEIQHPNSDKTDIYWVNGMSNKWQVGMYIADMNFWTYEGAGTQHVFKDEAKTVSIERNGGKSAFASATLDDEKVMLYSVTDKHMPSTPIKRALKVSLADNSKEVVSIDFKFNEDPKNASGEVLKPSMFVHDVDYRNDGVFGANYAIVDENGKPTVDIEVGKWYTLYITTEGRRNYLIYPMGEISEQITCNIAFKNLQSYDYDLGMAKMISSYGKVSHVSLYKNSADEWGYSYTSYTGWHTDANTAWNRRPLIKVADGIVEVRFRFKFNVSDYIPAETGEAVKNLQLWAGLESSSGPTMVTTIVDDNFSEVAAADRELNTWYTAVITTADGGALPTSFNLLPGGYADGGKGTIVNLDIDFMNLVGYKAETSVTATNPENTISITGTTLSVEENSTTVKHALVEEKAPYSPAGKAIKLSVLDDSKQVISMKFTVNKMNSIENEPMPAWVRVETETGYDGNYVVIDENGDACKYIEAGKTYTLFITRPENIKAAGGAYGQNENPTEFVVYLTGKDGPQIADVDIIEMKMHEVTAATTANGGLTYQTKLIHGNATYYEYDGKWNIAYTSHYSLYRGSPTATDNSAENREFFVSHNGTKAVQLRFKLRFVEGTANGAANVTFLAADQNISFYKDGMLVSDREVGTWYDVVITNTNGYVSDTFTIYGCGYDNTYPVDFQYQIADLQIMTPEDFPDIMVTTSSTIGAAVWRYTEEDGWHWFVPNNGANVAADYRRAMVTLPEDGMTGLTYEVKFNEVTGEALPYMGLTQGVNKYYDLETGELVGSGNGVKLEIGKWYKVEYATNNKANMGTTPWIFAYSGGFGAGNLSFSVRNVEAIGAEKFDVSFDLNYEGAENNIASIQVTDGKPYGELPTPERENFKFDGWYLNAECTGTAVTAETVVSQAHTLYAKWTPDEVPVVEFATPGALADPVMAYVDGKIVYTINGSAGTELQSSERKLTATLIDGNALALSFEMKLSNLTAVSASLSGADNALSVKFYNAEGAEVTALSADAWYKVVVAKADGTAFGDTAWNLGYLGGTGRGSGKLDVEIRNVVATLPEVQKAEVSFDLNYEGAIGAPATMEIENGQPYGELPVPARAGYTFGGWFTDAACTGEAVTAETIVSESHTLYAKWDAIAETDEVDDNPVVVVNNAEYNENNAKLIHTFDGEKHLYTYTTRGVNSPTTSPWGRRVKISFPAGQQYVAVEFRYTEAYAADGVTEIAPSLGIYCNNEGAGGSWISSLNIFDSTGARVTGSNNKDGLTVGEWYTLIVGTKEATDYVELWTAHNYTDDAAILTMEFRDRACVAELDLKQADIKFDTPWDDFANPLVSYVDGNWCYSIGGSKQSVPAEHRQLNVTLTNGTVNSISFEFKMNGFTNGTSVSLPGGVGTKTITNLDGSAVSELQGDTWYKLTAVKDGGFGTDSFVLGYTGGYANSAGLNMFIRNIVLAESGAPEEPGETEESILVAVTPTDLVAATSEQKTAAGVDPAQKMYAYTKENGTSSNNLDSAAVYFSNEGGYDYITFDFYYASMPTGQQGGKPYLNLKAYEFLTNSEGNTTMLQDELGLIVVNKTTGEVTNGYPNADPALTWGTVEMATWYTVTMKVTDWSRVNFAIWTSGSGTVYFTNIQGHVGELPENPGAPSEPAENPTLVARNPAYLSKATAQELEAAGITGATETVYRFTKGVGSADINSGDYGLWLENRNSNAYVTFDVRYSEAAGKNPYLLLITRLDGGDTDYLTTSDGIIFVKKGTDISAEESDGAYNWIELNTWYTVTVPMAERSEIYLAWDTNDSATAFITNIVWSDEIPEIDEPEEIPEDTNPVTVSAVGNGIMTSKFADGKHVYNWTTRGVENPTAGTLKRPIKVIFPEGQTHVAVKFRFTESLTADGADLAPYVRVYDKYQSGNGGTCISTIGIYDENGNEVSKNNDAKALAVGQWYTLIVGMKTGTDFYIYPLSHYTTDVPILTMEFCDRSSYVSNGVVPSTVETFARPNFLWTEADGWHYFIPDNGNTATAWQRRTYISIPQAGMTQLAYEVKINSTSGNTTKRIRVNTGTNAYYDIETGALLSTAEGSFYLEEGKWYRVVHVANDLADMGTSNYIFCYPGDSGANGNVSVSFRNFEAMPFKFVSPTESVIATTTSIGEKGVEFRYTSKATVTGDNRAMRLNTTAGGYKTVAFEICFNDCTLADGTTSTAIISHSFALGGAMSATWYDMDGNVVTERKLGQWYTVELSGSVESSGIWLYMGSIGQDVKSLDISVRNFQAF